MKHGSGLQAIAPGTIMKGSWGARDDLGGITAADVDDAGFRHFRYRQTFDGLVRIGVQSAIAHPETSALLRKLMKERNLPVPQEGRTLASICIVDICK